MDQISATEKIKASEVILKVGIESGNAKVVKTIHGKPMLIGTLNRTENQSRLMAYLNVLQGLKEKIVDLKSLEREVKKMPELLRRVVIALVERLNASSEGCTRLAAQAEEAVKAIDSLSFSPTGGHAQ